MDSTVMDLIDAHDIFCPGQTNVQTVKDFLNTLQSFQCIENCDSKQLQQFSSKINSCLNSQSHEDKFNALYALEILVQQCSADFFNQNIGSFINSILHQVLKSQQIQPQVCNQACQVLAKIINFAPSFPDVSRQISSLATTLITCMIEISNKNCRCLANVMHCLSALMSNYPGACGGNSTNLKNLESLLVRNMSRGQASAKQLSKCYALLPRLGGGGKGGINHIESWSFFSEKLINTAQHIIQEIADTLPNVKKQSIMSNEPKLNMPTDPSSASKDLLKKVYFRRSQLNILCRCLIELYAAPFPYPKNIRPSKVLQLVKVLSKIRMSSLATGLGHENKVVLAVLPDLYVSVIQVLLEFLRCFSEDLVLFIPEFLKLIVQACGDIRQIGGIRQHGQKAFTLLKVSLYKLLITLCDTFGAGLGLENYATELIPFLMSDIVPANETITLTVTGAAKNQTGKKHKKKPSNQYFGGQISTHKKVDNVSNSSLVSTSLDALSAVFGACGTFISQSFHKNVQCCILAICLELQRCSVGERPIPFDDPECRRSLYQALLELLLNTHPHWPAPFRHAYHIFHAGYLNDHPKIRVVCGRGLSLCETISQPRSSTLNLEFPMSPEEIVKIKEEAMKVHTIVLASHSMQLHQNGMPLQFSIVSDTENTLNSNGGTIEVDDPERMKVSKVNNENNTSIKEDFNKCAKQERINNPAYKLLSGRETAKLPEDTSSKRDINRLNDKLTNQSSENEGAYIIPDTAEREEIMRSFYDFDREPIFIPDEVKNREYNKVSEDNHTPKKQKVSGALEACATEGPSSETKDSTDLETMLGTFVNKFIDE